MSDGLPFSFICLLHTCCLDLIGVVRDIGWLYNIYIYIELYTEGVVWVSE